VKTLVQDDVQSENVTFFTARSPTLSWANSPGTALDGPAGDDSLTRNANYPMDDTFLCRIIHGKKGHTRLVVRQLATWEEEDLKEGTAKDDSELHPSEEQLLTTRMMASKIWFSRREHRVNCREGFKIVKL